MSDPVVAVVAEDEPRARRSLVELLVELDWIECAGEAGDGREAIRVVERVRPDVLFLDVRMPLLSGLEVLDALEHRPLVVFTTAYDEYAVPAFELGAVDYLVKPFGRRRLAEALSRVRESLRRGVSGPPLQERFREVRGSGPLRRLFLRLGDRILPVAVEDVDRFEADGSYVRVHSEGRDFLLGVPMGTLERRLDAEGFLRVHRSHIVNLDRVRQMREFDDRRLVVEMRDGSKVVASRAGTRRLRRLID